MALVNYSDSDSDGSNGKNQDQGRSEVISSLKRKRQRDVDESKTTQPSSLPPLPVAFHDLYATNVRVSVKDDPSLHGGRKRTVPHVEGNWPTHVYLEWYPTHKELRSLSNLISRLNDSNLFNDEPLQSLLQSDLGARLPLHISLSRPIVLLTDQRQAFYDSITEAVKSSAIKPFTVTVTGLSWVSNFDKTRWFLIMHLSRPDSDALNKLLQLSNRVLHKFGQPPLYDERVKATGNTASRRQAQRRGRGLSSSTTTRAAERMADFSSDFHISIAWKLGEPTSDAKDKAGEVYVSELSQLDMAFDNMKVKIGNAVHSIYLHTGKVDGKGFGGL